MLTAVLMVVVLLLTGALLAAMRHLDAAHRRPTYIVSIFNDNRSDNRRYRGGDTYLTQVDARQLHLHQGSADSGERASHDYSAVLSPRQRAQLAARQPSPYPDALPGEVLREERV